MADLSISSIEIMGLIGENCAKCTEAAEDPNGGGLAGSWWRAWAKVSPHCLCVMQRPIRTRASY